MHLAPVDYAIIVIYFAFVLGIGFALRGRMKTSEDFFLSGRSIPGWITGLAFMSANLGALEVMGMAANSAKYGMIINHFYWLGAIPAMCFVGVFMMPFYYGSKARSDPEYLRLRYNEKTRTLNALSFATLTLLVSGIDLYAMAILFQRLLGWPFFASVSVDCLAAARARSHPRASACADTFSTASWFAGESFSNSRSLTITALRGCMAFVS